MHTLPFLKENVIILYSYAYNKQGVSLIVFPDFIPPPRMFSFTTKRIIFLHKGNITYR